MAKVAKNLSLDPDVVAKAEEYARRHRTSVSALVGNFLERLVRADELPEGDRRAWSSTVERLIGIAQSADQDEQDPRDEYRRYLEQKYLG